MRRKRRRRNRSADRVCRCSAYKFPHRQFGGDCELLTYVIDAFDPDASECQGCISFEKTEDHNGIPHYDCQVCNGREGAAHCPLVRDYIRWEGINVYGAARQQLERAAHKKVGYHGPRR